MRRLAISRRLHSPGRAPRSEGVAHRPWRAGTKERTAGHIEELADIGRGLAVRIPRASAQALSPDRAPVLA
jgi:hypothetical protein